MSNPEYKRVEDLVGNTSRERLQRVLGSEANRRGNVVLAKLEGDNPVGGSSSFRVEANGQNGDWREPCGTKLKG